MHNTAQAKHGVMCLHHFLFLLKTSALGQEINKVLCLTESLRDGSLKCSKCVYTSLKGIIAGVCLIDQGLTIIAKITNIVCNLLTSCLDIITAKSCKNWTPSCGYSIC